MEKLKEPNLFNFWGAAIMVEIQFMVAGGLTYLDPLTVKRDI